MDEPIVQDNKNTEQPGPEIQEAKAPAEEKPKKSCNKKKRILIGSAIAAVALIAGSVSAFFLLNKPGSINNATENSEDQELASEFRMRGNEVSDFDLSFLKLENNGKNKIYSPLSIKYALAMLSEGANGETKQQIDSIIGDYQFKKYLNSKNLSLANAVFIRDQYKGDIKESFIGNLKDKFNAEVSFNDFSSAKPINDWVSKNTFKQIPQLLDDASVQDPSSRLILVNALAIDMKWNYLIQCTVAEKSVPCIYDHISYNFSHYHENYTPAAVTRIIPNGNDTYGKTIKFNGKKGTKALEIAANINDYDIIKEVGESKIRETVQAEYQKWLKKEKEEWCSDEDDEDYESDEDEDEEPCSASGERWERHIKFNLEEYMKELGSNYGTNNSYTDFYTYSDDNVSVFAKDLKEYDKNTLQYIGIMPKTTDLSTFINDLNAKKVSSIISNLKTIDPGFDEGYVTKIFGSIPIFNFDYKLNLLDDLKNLGITNAFSEQDADFSNMSSPSDGKNYFVTDAVHKANIDFSNEGIKAAAATAIDAGAGAGGDFHFDYLWDVPIKEIDLTFNKPYLFLIRDKASNEVWFTGTVYEPSHK